MITFLGYLQTQNLNTPTEKYGQQSLHIKVMATIGGIKLIIITYNIFFYASLRQIHFKWKHFLYFKSSIELCSWQRGMTY